MNSTAQSKSLSVGIKNNYPIHEFRWVKILPFLNISFRHWRFESDYIYKCTVHAGLTSAKIQCVFLRNYL